MSHAERIIILIALLLVAGLYGVYYAGRQTKTAQQIADLPILRGVLPPAEPSEPSDTPLEAPAPATPTDALGWKTYHSEKYGFAIDYQGEYRIDPQSDGRENVRLVIFPYHWQEDGSISAEGYIGVMFYPNKKIPRYGTGETAYYESLDAYLDFVREGNVSSTCVEEQVAIAGTTARKLSCRGPEHIRPYDGYFIEQGDDLYAVVVSSAIKTSDGRDPAPIVERMLASFSFE